MVEAAEAPAQPIELAKVESIEEVKERITFVFGSHAQTALCIAKNESGYVPSKVGYNHDLLRTHDRGVFQLNSYWHREVSDAQAYDAKTNIAEAFRISKGGTDWSQWTTHTKCGV